MKVLVTGGTGYLGRAVVDRLAARGHTPLVFARRPLPETEGHASARPRTEGHASARPRTEGHASAWPRYIQGDVRDADAVANAMRGCDAVCHLAALVSIWQPEPRSFDAVNIGGLQHVIAAVERAGLPRLVCASSFLARPPRGQGAPLAANDYQRTKVAADARMADAIARGVPLVRLYPGVIYGPGPATEGNLVGRLLRDHLAGRLPGLVGADRQWSFAFVSDVGAAFVTALERGAPGNSYDLGGDNVPQMRLFEIVRDLTGHPLPRRLPAALARAVGAVEELRARWTQRAPLVTRGAVEIFQHDWPLDSDAAVRDLDYRVRPLREGIATLLDPAR